MVYRSPIAICSDSMAGFLNEIGIAPPEVLEAGPPPGPYEPLLVIAFVLSMIWVLRWVARQ